MKDVLKDILTDDEISHPLNENLLHEAEEIKGERKTYKERLERLEETRSQVSDAVYQRVRSDYTSKLDTTMKRLITLKKDLESEEKQLVDKKNLVEGNIRFHRERIEESSLRSSLGEYTAEQHRELITREEQEIARLETALKVLSEGVERHLEIFAGEEFAPPQTPPVARVTELPPVSRPPAAPKVASAAELPPISQPPSSPAPVSQPTPAPVTENTARIRVDTPPAPATASAHVPEIVVMENGKPVQNVPIDHTIQIGRSPSNDIVLKEPKVSRKHAEVQCVGGNHVILDLESSNGTYVSGKKVTEQILRPNDEIVIGNTKMVFKA